jgi:large repetitive protein
MIGSGSRSSLTAFLFVLSFAAVLNGATHITTTSLPGGTVGQPYSASLSVTGGTAPYSWSLSAGSLPAGLALSSAGTISGSPTSPGTSNFTIKVTGSGKSESDTQALSLVVAPALTISTSSFLAGQVSIAYSQTLQASGGTPPYAWSISSGPLPAGLVLSAAQITGTPSAAGTANFTVKVVDANSVSVTRALSITVTPAPVSITTASLPNGQVGVSYTQNLQASGGAGTYTWSVSAGTLPSGLSLGASGQITGTPAASGNASFTVKVIDPTGSATRVLSINIAAVPIAITTTSLPGGEVGMPYSQTLQASGGTGSYTWSVSSGALPLGLTLNSTGRISGTPTAAANASFSLEVSDSTGSSTAALAIAIAPALTAPACPAATGVVGQVYSATLNASGGTPPYAWTLASGQLPAGLMLNPASGQISGTPSAAGTFSFGIKVSDQNSAIRISNCTVLISAPASTLTITTVSFPNGVVGNSYAQVLSATGGQPPYTWTVSGGSLPAGLSLNGGQVSGTLTASGTFQFSLRLSDSAGTTATKNFTIQVGAALTIVTSSLTSLRTGVAASQQLSAAGGVPPYLWSLVSGGLPSGLTLSPSGSISGTPNSQGNFTFAVRVTDSATSSVQRTFTLAVSTSLVISACPVSNATQGQSYASSAVASGGQPPYTWTLASGTLPAGILFNRSSGGLSGIPTDSGTYPYTLLITDQGGATATRDCQLLVTSSLVIGASVLPDASQSSPYTQSLSASGGKSPYTWSIVAGSLPTGLILSPAGVISGVTVTLGSFSFTVSVTDGNGANVQRALSIRVVSGLNVISCSGSVSEVGLVFNSLAIGSGGSPPYTWNVSAGSLPPGLTLDPSSGVIVGTPLQPGSVQFTVEVRDSTNHAATRQCSIDVAAPVTISTSALSTGSSSLSYSDSIAVTGGIAPFVWATTAGALPPGLSLNPTSGHITGIPLVVGAFAFTAKVIDAMGGQATKDLSIVIAQGLTIPDCPNPAAVVGLSYSALLTAIGGTSPYQWRVDSGTLPPGLMLSSEQAAINGSPLQSGLSAYVLRVDDASGKSSSRLCSIQVNPPGLIITSSASLPNGLIGNAYNQTLAATGGRPPYSWSITTAGAPIGISLDATGALAGLPSAAGTFSFTVQVTDQDNSVVRQIVTLAILAGNPPTITITGLPDIVDPAQQPAFAMQLNSGYPDAINGILTLVFTPDPAVGVDDPAVQFAAGGRVLTFTVPPNATQVTWSAPVAAFQTGTVSGTIDLNVKLVSNGTDITPPDASRTIRVDRLAPRIASVQVVKTSAGFDVHLTGFATTREVTQGTFQFAGDTAASITNITVPLGSSSKTWFQSADSQRFGGQFGLVQSFQWQGQPSGVLNSVSVSLTNAQGASEAVQARF